MWTRYQLRRRSSQGRYGAVARIRILQTRTWGLSQANVPFSALLRKRTDGFRPDPVKADLRPSKPFRTVRAAPKPVIHSACRAGRGRVTMLEIEYWFDFSSPYAFPCRSRRSQSAMRARSLGSLSSSVPLYNEGPASSSHCTRPPRRTTRSEVAGPSPFAGFLSLGFLQSTERSIRLCLSILTV